MTAIIGLITAAATIVGGLVYLVKLGVFETKKSPDEQAQEIAVQEQKNKQQAEQSGRPV